MNSFRRKIRNNKGFTLLETMGVVAIIVILLAIAVPGITSLKLGLDLTGLDSTARQIFIAAQNNLVSIKAQGGLDLLSGTPIQRKPDDFDDTGLVWGDEELLYVESGTGFAEAILPVNSIESYVRDTGGKYVIEFCRETASVYGVFYTDNPAGFAYSAMKTPSRDRSVRKNAKPLVGYYGGAGIDSADIFRTPDAELTISNAETLTAVVKSVPATKYTVRIASVSYPELYKEYAFYGDAPQENLPDNVTYDESAGWTILLDSLEEKKHFADIFAVSDGDDSTPITPGDNLTVSVSAVSLDETRVCLPSTVYKITNSLFAERAGNNVNVSSCRHLQNLEPTVSNLSFAYQPAGITKTVAPVAAVRQTKAINWEFMRVRNVTGFFGSPLSSAAAGKFVSIVDSGITEYNGAGLAITGLDIVPNGGYAGLFGKVDGTALANIGLTNVVIVNPRLAGAADYAGILAGRAVNCDFDGCRVYVRNSENYTQNGISVSGTSAAAQQYIGGMAGMCDASEITDCCAALAFLNADNSSTGDVYAGGLIGTAHDSNISSSFADISLFAGEGAPKMFASGVLLSTVKGVAGGFVGAIDGTANTVTDCYSVGNVCAGGGALGGFVGTASGIAFTNCYSASMFEGNASASTYGFAKALTGTSFTSCRYLKQADPSEGDAAGIDVLSYSELHLLKLGALWSSASAGTTVPLASTGKYPFPRLTAFAHYGDWPHEIDRSIDSLLVYYEKNTLGEYSYYADGVNITPALRNDGKIVEDGYAILLAVREYDALGSNKAITVTYSGSRTQQLSVRTVGNNPVTVTANGGTYYEYPIRPFYDAMTLSEPMTPGAFYHSISLKGRHFRFNPNFARTAVNNLEPNGEPTAPTTAYIRTARQISALGTRPDYWNMNFVQERDVDFSAYISMPLTITPIGTASQRFGGSYNGGSHIVSTNVGITSQLPDVGLFGVTSSGAGLSNIIFVSDFDAGVASAVAGTGNVGSLVGRNGGTITNCAVAGFAVSGYDSGGLVGYNEQTGSITKSSAGCAYFTPNVTVGGSVTGDRKIGGFVGINDGTISNCYAVARVTTWHAGGFVGQAGSGIISRSYCASLGDEGYLGFAFDNRTIIGCYSLSDNPDSKKNEISYAELKELSFILGTGGGWGNITQTGASFRYSGSTTAGIYPFPAVVTRSGAKVHYGNWPF